MGQHQDKAPVNAAATEKSEDVNIELVVSCSDQILQQFTVLKLAKLCEKWEMKCGQVIRFLIRFESSLTGVLETYGRRTTAQMPFAAILISDVIGEKDGSILKARKEARHLVQRFRVNGKPLGLLALVEQDLAELHGEGLDGVISLSSNLERDMRRILQHVTMRIWWRAPVQKRRRRDVSTSSIKVDRVETLRDLKDCFRLRKEPYAALGYLPERFWKLDFEMDRFDPVAHHFMATIPNSNGSREVIGTMRLIIPGARVNRPRFRNAGLDFDYSDLCEQLAAGATEQIFSDPVSHPAAMPILRNIESEDDPRKLKILQEIQPEYSCELSRVVVAPEFRGLGVSCLMIKEAIRRIELLKRRYLVLECALHHEDMYRKYGFRVLEKQGQRVFTRHQALDCLAVAMLIELDPDLSKLVPFEVGTVQDGPLKGLQVKFLTGARVAETFRTNLITPAAQPAVGSRGAAAPLSLLRADLRSGSWTYLCEILRKAGKLRSFRAIIGHSDGKANLQLDPPGILKRGHNLAARLERWWKDEHGR